MFHLLAYNVNAGANAADTDMTAAVDAEFSRRNSHYIFSEQYNLIGAYAAAPSLLRVRTNIPSINAIGRHQVYPINVDADVPADPDVQDLRDYPMPLPMNEEVALEVTNNLAMGNEQTYGFLWVAPPAWNKNLPRGLQQLNIRATGAVAAVAQSWSSAGALTFADNLRGGWYAIVGAQCFDALTLALRFIFPKAPMYQGRKLRPGILCQQSFAEKPWRAQSLGYGEFGRFHSFEPPQIEIYASNTAASVQEIRLDIVYLGERGG